MSDSHSSGRSELTPVYVVPAPRRTWLILLMASVFMNFLLLVAIGSMQTVELGPEEKFHSGDESASDKIARVNVDFTIMPPYTDRIMEILDTVEEQDDVKGILLVVNSPGGLVSDSHDIYHRLKEISESKPVWVYMKGLAASGGYYVSMGAGPQGKIYADPTTWTGSIGVIMPRYDVSELASKIGVASDSLATGPLKDTLNPLKPMTEREREVWNAILDESFDRFLTIIDENRDNLDMDQVRELATGQVYTATQALENGLIDEIGYEEDVVDGLKSHLGLTRVRVVDYETPKSFVEELLGVQSRAAAAAEDPLTRLLDAGVPRAMYIFGWHPGLTHSRAQ